MKRILSSIGIGAASVDTVLPRTELHPGETVEADVELHGGEATQEIEGIYFALQTVVDGEDGTDERTLSEFRIDQSIELSPDEERTIPVAFEVPLWTPLSRGGADVWLETGLDVDWATDPTDEDRIEVVPDPYVAALFEAIEDLGFAMRYTELVETDYLDDRPFAQEFDFRPGSAYRDQLDELEVTVMPRGSDLRVFVEFDTHDAVADEYDMDFDEMEAPYTFDEPNAESIRRRLVEGIDQHT